MKQDEKLTQDEKLMQGKKQKQDEELMQDKKQGQDEELMQDKKQEQDEKQGQDEERMQDKKQAQDEELMQDKKLTVGLAVTGSFCTFAKIKEITAQLAGENNMRIIPIYSFHVKEMDTRFGRAEDFCREMEEITGEKGISTMQEAEPIGPSGYLDALIIAPCTGNTMAKLCAGITDSPVLMAAKAHLRNEKPLILSISTNDALGMNFKNIGMLMNMKHIYFVPFGQDNYEKKTNSMIAHTQLIGSTLKEALKGKQVQPVIMAAQ